MGNRAFVTNKDMELGVYLHWNGGRDSIEAFCKYCELRGFRDDDYGMARFVQVVANYFGGCLSIGIEPFKYWTMGDDNGLYVIDNWKIVGRYAPRYMNVATGKIIRKFDYYDLSDEEREDYAVTLGPWDRPEQNSHPLWEMVSDIDAAQPIQDQIGDLGKCIEVPIDRVRTGDVVKYSNWRGRYVTSTVVDDAEQTAKVEPEPYRYVLTDDGEKVYEGSRYLVIRQ